MKLALVSLVSLMIALNHVLGTADVALAEDAKSQSDPAAIERARQSVRMLDNVYKQTIVLITEKYVHDENDFPAGSAAVMLFDRISKSGSHHVRLIDATGEPIDAENVAKTDFEKQGVKRLKEGDEFVDEVVEIDGKLQLLALTPVPVVMEKCIMCHEHYADAKEGEPIGAISYVFPVQ